MYDSYCIHIAYFSNTYSIFVCPHQNGYDFAKGMGQVWNDWGEVMAPRRKWPGSCGGWGGKTFCEFWSFSSLLTQSNSTVVDLMLKFKSNLLLVVLVALRWFLCKSCCMILLLNHSISRVFDLAASKNEDKPNWLVSHMSIPKKDMFEGVIRVIKFSRKHPGVNFHIRVASGIRGCAIGGGLCVCVQS